MKNDPVSNLVLIGFMGSGKTTVGRALSKRLALTFFDMDLEIESVCGCGIPHIFKEYGEYYFRGVEARVTGQAVKLKNTVIATGGGIVKNQANMETLAKSGIIVYLRTTAKQVYINTLHDTGRPLLEASDKERAIAELLRQREPLYEKYSDFTLDVAGKNVEEIVNSIMKKIGVDLL